MWIRLGIPSTIFLLTIASYCRAQPVYLERGNYLDPDYIRSHKIKHISAYCELYTGDELVQLVDTIYVISYNEMGNVVQKQFRNYGDSANPITTLNYFYDDKNNITKTEAFNVDKIEREQLTYSNTYNNGKIIRQMRHDSLVEIKYDYDKRGRLLSKQYFGKDTAKGKPFFDGLFVSSPPDLLGWGYEKRVRSAEYFFYRRNKLYEKAYEGFSLNYHYHSPDLRTCFFSYDDKGRIKLIKVPGQNLEIKYYYNSQSAIVREVRKEVDEKSSPSTMVIHYNVVYY